ncbi:MAG: cation-transporting P-type ATPase [Candidatus Thiodiazotropha sp. (ex Ctena orbiculata)]|nr:cation-transporting P-type ATPase [Candidatus Thiodiazotropha taylori]MBT2996785.1 cation-transporting P-type ATPase [Candidatus Thiodiazotropha taylori]MBT3002018.1 cation-transporting P-type ATPase [Candidatus Thiodiazotropha taylori]MBT3027144.1 cation-transporting P-type ATPase [Candidatus Thiodiazotropha taylori]MBT3034778.1 cation-transporting P-type ATPase [Candidatus Thiodiazotropha taylori]
MRAHWHSIDVEKLLQRIDTSETGLSTEEAALRLQRYGPNRLPEPRPRHPLVRFLYQFHNVLIYVLIVAAVVTSLLQHWLDASVIFGVVIVNALIGHIQEGKAEDALKAIRLMLSPRAMVMRNGRQISIDAEQLVVGDIVLLQSGDRVPADLRLVQLKGLQIQESALTGESMPVEKCTQSMASDLPLADRSNMAYSGTLVTHGKGSGVVVTTGAETEIGHISSLVAEVEQVTTPLLRQMAQFGRWLTGGILVIALFTFFYGVVLRDYTMTEMFLASVSLAVAAIPEGLPAIMTITLAVGVQRMAQRNAIIRRLPAVETLGSVKVICSDKTGTLTRNEMTVRSIATAHETYAVSGTGYDSHGTILPADDDLHNEEQSLLNVMIRGAVLCNDASLESHDDEWRVNGDPMEGALLIAGIKAGLDIDFVAKQYPRNDLIPFESEHRFMATLHHSHTGTAFIILKGAPERLLKLCKLQRTLEGDCPLEENYWNQRIESLAGQGQRVLAIAVKQVPGDRLDLNFQDVEDGMVLLGLFGLIDPPREEAIKAVAVCAQAGIRVKMITGDHSTTAQAIARQLSLVNTEEVLSGQDLQAMDDATLRGKVKDIDVYARVSPEHKLRLVTQLQALGYVAAMTGDGVNDSPALKRADVGTAMGMNGTEAAKEASEMVLADDNFASIVHAVKEGRTVYDNLRKAILFILPTNGGEALIILSAIILGFHQLPLTPVQILWVNMITAVTLALSLAVEPPETNVMTRAPRKSNAPLLTGLLLWRIAFVSAILTGGTIGLFIWVRGQGMNIEEARTVAVNALVMFEIFYLFNARYMTASVLNWKGFVGNRYVLYAIGLLLIFQMGFTYQPHLQLLFGTRGLDFSVWIRITLVAASVLLLVEIEKSIVRSIIESREAKAADGDE